MFGRRQQGHRDHFSAQFIEASRLRLAQFALQRRGNQPFGLRRMELRSSHVPLHIHSTLAPTAQVKACFIRSLVALHTADLLRFIEEAFQRPLQLLHRLRTKPEMVQKQGWPQQNHRDKIMIVQVPWRSKAIQYTLSAP